jgi:hypothetical protein
MIADSELQAMLQDYVNALSGTWNIDLFQNNHTPAEGDTSANYTVANFTGYAQGSVVNANWGAVSVTAHVASTTQSSANVFTAGSTATAQTVYGYYITDSGGVLKYAESFASPVTMNPTDQLSVTPVLKHTVYP